MPRLGLDPDGSILLDYGARRFRVAFDEHLVPFVTDQAGIRRSTLPKPAATDDANLAPAAFARFAALKKDVRRVGPDQIRRLEAAMVTGRRWTAAEQLALFVDHPLLRHLARRLVWATFDDGGTPTGSFRVTDDGRLTGPADEAMTIPDDSIVGIAHPLHLHGTLRAWKDLFARRDLRQPFPQLCREVRKLSETERASTLLDRIAGITVPNGKLLGLARRGWDRGELADNGIQMAVHRVLPGGWTVIISFEPGISIGMGHLAPEQTVTTVWLNDGPAVWWAGSEGRFPFGELDPVSASEVLLDLESLGP